MKADFIAYVSHELRTPLTGIREGTALLLEQIPGPLTTSQQQILEVVRNHSARLAQHISSILDLSKMEADMLEYVQAPSDLAVLLERSVEAIALVAYKKQLHIEVLGAFPLPFLCLDAGRIQQVLDNVLSNAVKFTPAGGTIKVSASLQGDGGRYGSVIRGRASQQKTCKGSLTSFIRVPAIDRRASRVQDWG
jgi:two-component system sensor histidine kinase GlrK